MPRVDVVFYRDDDGTVPALEWLQSVGRRDRRIADKLQVRLERLGELGYELTRPEADYLRDGIYELRARLGTVNYRLLYFFNGRVVAVLCHGLTKEAEVPSREIDVAVARRDKFMADAPSHTFTLEQEDEEADK